MVLIKKFISGWNLWRIYFLQTSKPDIEVLNTFYWGLVNWICFQGLSFLFMELKKKKTTLLKYVVFWGKKRKLILGKKGKFQVIVLDSTKPEKKVSFQDLFF